MAIHNIITHTRVIDNIIKYQGHTRVSNDRTSNEHGPLTTGQTTHTRH